VVSDGRIVYLLPGPGKSDVERFDSSSADFTSGQLTPVDTSPQAGFCGGVWDGRYVYLAPGPAAAQPGVFVRIDPQGADAGGGLSSFRFLAMPPGSKGFCGGVFDGRYVYFAPTDPSDGIVARYDTMPDAFDQDSSWDHFDVTQAIAGAHGFHTGA